jgi:hypothetical protein
MKGHHRMADEKPTIDEVRVPRRSAVKRIANMIGDNNWARAELLVDEQVASGNLHAFCMYGALSSEGNEEYLSETVDISNPLEISQKDWKKVKKNTEDDGGQYVDHEERILRIGRDDKIVLYNIFFYEDDLLRIDWISAARGGPAIIDLPVSAKPVVPSLMDQVFALADEITGGKLPNQRGDQKRLVSDILKRLSAKVETVERYVREWKRIRNRI